MTRRPPCRGPRRRTAGARSPPTRSRRSSAGSPQTPTIVSGSPPATTTTVTGLTNGTAYTFTVAATNSVGTGSASAASAAVTPVPATVPGQVTGVSAVAGNASAALSWTAPLDGGAALTNYTVTPSLGGVPQTPVVISGTPPATGSTISGLTNGATYTFTVTATNVVGTGASSPPSAAVTPSVPISPVVDTQVSANATGTTATTPTFSTAQAGETLVAFVAADGPLGTAADGHGVRRRPDVDPGCSVERPSRRL